MRKGKKIVISNIGHEPSPLSLLLLVSEQPAAPQGSQEGFPAKYSRCISILNAQYKINNKAALQFCASKIEKVQPSVDLA